MQLPGQTSRLDDQTFSTLIRLYQNDPCAAAQVGQLTRIDLIRSTQPLGAGALVDRALRFFSNYLLPSGSFHIHLLV
jgi:hypothetical protein